MIETAKRPDKRGVRSERPQALKQAARITGRIFMPTTRMK